jgi:hypothetical protein
MIIKDVTELISLHYNLMYYFKYFELYQLTIIYI